MKNLLFLGIVLLFLSSCNNDNSPDDTPTDPDPVEEKELAQVRINTNEGTIVDEPKINAEMTITKNDSIDFDGFIGIEYRGAFTQQFYPKKSYGLETRDENNEDLDVSLLGFPEEEDWILHAPYSDKTLMRNVLIYELSRDIGMYASRTKFVELTVNDTYEGVYVLMEKLKRDSQRIDINKLKEDENSGEDLTGGYILKIDKTAGNNLGVGYNDLNSFTSAYLPNYATEGQEINFLYEYPDAEDITDPQKTYISTYINDFENALASDDFADPMKGYAKYIDVPSFIDYFLLNEISNNVDAYRLSTFMHKDKGGKLKMGPIWDFNFALGNTYYCGAAATNVWTYRFNERCPGDAWVIPFWWERLLEDPNFVAQVKERWNTLRAEAFADATILSKIESYENLMTETEAADKNFDRWDILGIFVPINNFIGQTYQEENEFLKDWISDRTSWLDTAINSL